MRCTKTVRKIAGMGGPAVKEEYLCTEILKLLGEPSFKKIPSQSSRHSALTSSINPIVFRLSDEDFYRHCTYHESLSGSVPI